jgi:hypothetical protein
MICSTCQNVNPDTARFCRSCGAALTASAPTLLTATTPPASKPELDGQAGSLLGYVIDGKYRLDEVLGAGGMGQVYRATRLQIGDAVAVKLLKPELAASAQMLERFRREAQAAARLKHPNVVTIHDFGRTAEGWLYLVMELVAGESLRALLNRCGQLPLPLTAALVAQICAALDEAHRQQIVHRDLKPENIIVAQDTHGWRVKVLDFGIARWRDEAAGINSLTTTGVMLGTPRYMSPEQCLGLELDGRSDIYSLGIMLYELLAGCAPFNSPAAGALIAQHVNHPPPPLRSINLSIPPAVEAVVMRTLDKRPAARPQTAGELAQQLISASNGQVDPAPSSYRAAVAPLRPVPHAQAGGSESKAGAPLLTPPVKPRKRRLALWIMAVACALAGGVWTWLQMTPAGQDRTGLKLRAASLNPQPVGPLDLNSLPLEKALAQAEGDYQAGRYVEAINLCRRIVATVPEQPRATALLGQSYFNVGSFEGVSLLARALALGESVALPLKHHHYEGVLKLNDGFCAGELRLRSGELSFHSASESAHSFSVPPRGVIELRNDSHKAGRLHLKLAIPQGGLEIKQTYNFYPVVASLLQNRLRTSVVCDSPACQPMADALYQLLRQFKQ